MGRPSKPVGVIKSEGKAHRTKAELEMRERAERALLTKTPMFEWGEVKNDPVAHEEFLRINALLETLGKNDGLYEAVINRYAKMRSECYELESLRALAVQSMRELVEHKDEMEFVAYLDAAQKLNASIQSYERQIQAKRDMQLKIEKENIMTIASALRSVPKQPEDEQDSDPMLKLLGARGRA